MPDGRTRTDPTTFTEEELALAGYVAVPNRPDVSETEVAFWNYELGEWQVRNKTEDEILQEKKDYNTRQVELRSRAYSTESDPLFFKWQRGEATQQEWLDKVEEIKLQYPYIE